MQDGDAFAGELFDRFKYAQYVAIELFPVGAFSVGHEAIIDWIDEIVAGMFAAKRTVNFDVDDFADVFDALFHSVALNTGVAAVDWKDDAGDIAGLFRGEEDSGGVKFAFVAITLHRYVSACEFLEVLSIKNIGGKFGIEIAWADSVAGDAFGGELGGDGASEIDDATLAGVIGDRMDFGVADEAIHRGNIDDATIVVLLHNVCKGASHLKDGCQIGRNREVPLIVGHIKYTGVFGGTGTVQENIDFFCGLYIKDKEFELAIPNACLCGFKRVHVEAGSEQKATIAVDAKAFTSVDNDGNRKIFSKKFDIFAGTMQPDSRSEELTGHKCVSKEVTI